VLLCLADLLSDLLAIYLMNFNELMSSCYLVLFMFFLVVVQVVWNCPNIKSLVEIWKNYKIFLFFPWMLFLVFDTIWWTVVISMNGFWHLWPIRCVYYLKICKVWCGIAPGHPTRKNCMRTFKVLSRLCNFYDEKYFTLKHPIFNIK